jgi:hypothetical protein
VEQGVEFEVRALPETVAILAGDVRKELNPHSGQEMLQMTDMAVPVQMKDYGTFAATRTRPLPAGWVIPRAIATSPRMAAALDRLRWHGVRTETILADTQMDVDRFVISAISPAPRPSQGRQEARISGTLERASLLVDTGSVLVPGNQPLARLAFYLLEADSDDGLAAWNVIGEGLVVGQAFPVYRQR